MKKFLALLMCFMVLLSMVACGATDKTQSAESSKASTEEPATLEQATDDEIGGYKIGFYYLPDTDNNAAQYHRALEWCAEITNCEMEFYDATTFSSEELTTAVESLVSVGCDGVILVTGSAPSMFEYLNNEGVYYVGMTRSHTEEVARVTDTSEYCCGWLDENGTGINYGIGYGPTAILGEAGCKSIAYLASAPGSEMVDDRVSGIEGAAEEYNMEIVTSYRGSDFAAGVSDILAAYGEEIDGIMFSGTQDTVIAAIEAAGYGGKIKYAQTDAPSEPAAYMESGRLTACTAGNNAIMVQMYMQLFNAISGADRLFDSGEKLIPQIPTFTVSSPEDWANAEKYVMGDIPGLLPEDILSICSHYAPDTTVAEKEDLVRYWTSAEFWNIDSITERIAPYVE